MIQIFVLTFNEWDIFMRPNNMLLLTESAVHTQKHLLWRLPYGPNEVRSVRHDVTTNIFRMDQTQG